MKHNVKLMAMTIVLSSVLVLPGCDTMSTATKKRNLEVKTQMSETIWLEPSLQRTVHLQIKNISDKDISDLQAKVTKAVQDKGYIITSSSDSAHCRIQANALETDKVDLRTAQGSLSQGYEGTIAGTALGAGIASYNSSSIGTTLGVGLATSLMGMATDTMVGDIDYTMVTGIQISKKTTASVRTDNVTTLEQGTSRYKVQTSTRAGNQHKYQTRTVSSTNGISPKFEKAKSVLEDQLAKSVANTLQYTQGGYRATLSQISFPEIHHII